MAFILNRGEIMRSLIYGLVLAMALVPIVQVRAAGPDSNPKAKQIADALKQSGKLEDYRVGVKYEDGVAWLIGSVTSPQQKQIAEQIVLNCEGVSNIVSKLAVEGVSSQAQPKQDLKIQTASNVAPVAKQARQLKQRTQQTAPRARRAPSGNMPVPYARAGYPQGGPGIRPAGFNQHAQYSPKGGYMPGRNMGPAPMGAQRPAAVGQAVNYDNPQMPGYAWPSYAASPNYAALTYPKQYSASAWPYIGPFYPYPQVPLGWRKVTLEWDDGWWHLDFSDCKH
ncbi:MAG: hypothetical protein CMJ72_06525 [Planctomycetaceae bacterium]|nr:hypothetical protein [Planctomycetaceae bacterium]